MRFLSESFGSFNFSLNSSEIKAIVRGALLAAGGAVVAYLAPLVVTLDDGTAVGGMIAAVAAVAINALRKWLVDNSETPQ